MSGGPEYQNSGLRRFGEPSPIQPYNPGQFSAPTFQPPMLPPRQRFASPGASAVGGGLLDGGPGGNIGAPDPSTNPGLSNSIALGLIGTVLGPAAAFAADSAGIGASAPGGSSAADAPAGVGGLGGMGDTGFAPDGGDGGGGGGGGK